MRRRMPLAFPLLALVHLSVSAQTPDVIPTCVVGATLQLTTRLAAPVTWRLSPTSSATVLTVDSAGKVTCRSVGTAIVRATNASGQYGQENVRVVAAAPVPPPDTAPTPIPTPTPTPDPAGVVFRSDWSSGTGNALNVVQDGGKWNESYCSHQDVLSVVPGSTVGWTATASVLQVTNRGETRCWQIENTRSVPQGVSYYIRFYAMVDNETQTNFHPVSLAVGDGVVPTQMSPWSIESPTSAGWQPALRYSTVYVPYEDCCWKGPVLQRRTWYRFEYFVELLPNQRYRVHPRVFNMAGTLLFDASRYTHLDTPRTLKQFYDGGGSGRYQTTDAVRKFGLGYEGSAGASVSNGRWYYAAVELRTDTWPGPVR